MSTRLLGWLAFSGWVVIPISGLVGGAHGDGPDKYLADAGLLMIGGTFTAGCAGFARRLRRSPRTWGFPERGPDGASPALGIPDGT